MFGPSSDKARPKEPSGDSTSTEKVRKAHARSWPRSAVLGEPGGLASSEMRDVGGQHGPLLVQGRLVSFMDGYVRLMKDNGRTTTVPLYRLSANDLSFVNRQASAQPQETFAQAGNAGAAEALTAN